MANEFIARKGLISSGSINVSGSVTAFNFYGYHHHLVSLHYELMDTNLKQMV